MSEGQDRIRKLGYGDRPEGEARSGGGIKSGTWGQRRALHSDAGAGIKLEDVGERFTAMPGQV